MILRKLKNSIEIVYLAGENHRKRRFKFVPSVVRYPSIEMPALELYPNAYEKPNHHPLHGPAPDYVLILDMKSSLHKQKQQHKKASEPLHKSFN